VLASDGTLRWTGAPVGKLIAGEDVLRPRMRVIAYEQLTGASRDAVQARLDLWLKNHIERLLGPLFSLAAADDVTGIARGIAFQLIESIGILERQKVAEEVKGLDQPSRASLRNTACALAPTISTCRRCSKPRRAALAAQLWMLTRKSGARLDSLHLAASGRTSIPIDKDTPKPLYRTAGYRVCGERAVRVDILERLADLIRPALSWRETSPAPKPDSAFDGRGFLVTGAMTSLTGASGEDFASILRSLGYRMEKRLKPPSRQRPRQAATAAAPADDTAAEAQTATDAASAIETPEADAVEPAPTLAPDGEPAPVAVEAVAEPSTQPSAVDRGGGSGGAGNGGRERIGTAGRSEPVTAEPAVATPEPAVSVGGCARSGRAASPPPRA
jgi:ATP-dependent RNA helicase SUPV3L1/SUV3